ncbi:MAG: hypothetical protein M0Q26_02430 [Chitinophagaceae bacterium]|nr:hypothetical protein [Chitinophagaceae bacterium]MDP1812725.1 hypothetical protein [Sediminibacterium sp.]MDP3129621.1 hypothetical protein [Sediminibacterium sp.]
MQATINGIEPLLECVKTYSKTSLELLKLKSLFKTADILSAIASRLLLAFVLTVSVFTLTIAIALWLGDLTGKTYYGFLMVSMFYGLIGTIVFFRGAIIKTSVNNTIIRQILD